MPYIGNPITSGENNSFKVLDDITSYTLTFNGSSASIVSVANNTITYNSHRFITGQRVTYNTTGTTITGLTAATVYFIIKEDQNTIKLATTYANAINNTAIDLTGLGTGTTHTINVAFDGVNTKFKATYDNGTKAQITRAAQLTLSVNGVIQQPQDTISPTNGFGIDLDSVIIFSVAPLVTDIFWGNLVANNFPTFDISDNTVDSFTGTGSLTAFTLSKEPANSQNLLVTIDGVVQYPSDNTNVRAYSVVLNVLTFEGAPGNGTDIQVRHIGFAGATSSNVTGFYGRTGNVGLTTADNVNVGIITATSINVSGITTLGITSATSLVVSGISTLGITSATNLTSQSLVVSGISTLGITSATNITSQSLVVSGISTFTNGPVLVGTATSTGTASQPLQVTGGAYVSGNLGVGTTNPQEKLDVAGNIKVSSTSSITVGSAFIKNNAVGLGVTNDAGRNAGVSTATGTIIFNSNNAKVQVYNGTRWVNIGEQYIEATGGTISDYTSGGDIYRAHIFTSSGSLSVTKAPATQSSVEYLVVAGGGGGGCSAGGGGGAGGFRTASGFSVSPGPYSVTIGAGGGGASTNAVQGTPGTDSVFAPGYVGVVTSTGGGGGGSGAPTIPFYVGLTGGSAGGSVNGAAAASGNTPPTSPPQGNNGSAGYTDGVSYGVGGGGGGASAPGSTSPTSGGPGGNGTSSSISGITTHYAGGGGGGSHTAAPGPTGGTGGSGGGGNGGPKTSPGLGTSGTYSTGGGGGAGAYTGASIPGSSGGSGIVVVRYLIGELAATAKATGGLISYASGKTIHQFLSSGTFTVTNPGLSSVDYLVVAGGGGGGSYCGGGGGAGGMLTGSGSPVSPGAYPITVGAGGAGAIAGDYNGSKGINSTALGQIATGGGGGTSYNFSNSDKNGGSGGGGAGPQTAGTGTAGPPRQGYDGGAGATAASYYGGGGGGGAGNSGINGSGSAAGNGGPGAPSSITGAPVFYAGGGGGSTYQGGTVGLGGNGGGGLGGVSNTNTAGTPGTINLGGGGGAASYANAHAAGGSGGSGIVIIAYPS